MRCVCYTGRVEHNKAQPRALASRSDATDVDVVIIGGGVNGTGVARDAAMRGLRVALLDRNDLGFGASGNSSGMIHGGVRYLTDDPHVTETSCRDSGHIQAIAPHLLFRIPFLVPLNRGRFAWAWYLAFDGFFEAYDRFQPLKRGQPHVRLRPEELRQLEPGLVGDLQGGMSFDEWGIDGVRLCVANAIDAEERGGRVLVGVTAERIERDPLGAVRAVSHRDRSTGQIGRITTRAVVNATGAWAPLTASLAGLPAKAARVRPGKGIHVVFDRRLSNYAIVAYAIDGRQIFIEPWQNVSIIGTTDDDYYGDLDCVEVTFDEAAYLLQAVETVFPSIRDHRVIDTWAGIRPTLWTYGPYEDRLSREHRVFDHRAEGAEGLFSLAGGKLASYRAMAEEAADAVCGRLGHAGSCRTATEPLPGSEGEVDAARWAGELGVAEPLVRKLGRRYGCRAEALLREARAKEPTSGPAVSCRCEQVLEAEVRSVAKREWAQTLGDVMRRTRLGAGPCGGVGCAHRAAQVLALELGRDATWAALEAERFLVQRFRSRRPALAGFQARVEALNAAFLGLHGPNVPERRGKA
jgi:glycerol-3-phosphate dehydrogenase